MLQLPEKLPFFEELSKTSKKLVLVSATSVAMTNDNEEIIRVPCIYYPVWFQED